MAEYLGKIRKVIAEKTGLETSEITPESFIEDDLNIGDMELIEILEELEEIYHVEMIESSGDFETIQDMIDMLEENIQ